MQENEFSYIVHIFIQRQFECFENFNNKLNNRSINRIFNEITEIRNRFAHPPYDVETFLKTLSHYIPDLIDDYREAMVNIDLLILRSINSKIVTHTLEKYR
jgi:hypothetical protein